MHEPAILPTIGEIQRRCQDRFRRLIPTHRIEYAIRRHNIKPIARAGAAWIFSEEDATFIVEQIGKVDREREGAAL